MQRILIIAFLGVCIFAVRNRLLDVMRSVKGSCLIVVKSIRRWSRSIAVTGTVAMLLVGSVGAGLARADDDLSRFSASATLAPQERYLDLEDAGVHKEAVEALAAEGIFLGTECAFFRLLFCPDKPLSRRDMAIWLVRLLDAASPARPDSVRFVDVPVEQWWAPHVERLAEWDVTRGCAAEGEARYCPDRPVTRGQMAAFLVRAFRLPRVEPAGFADTAGHFFRHEIDALAAARITLGCISWPTALYCPDRPVTRAEMASFLHRARATVKLGVHISWVNIGSLAQLIVCPLDRTCRRLLVELRAPDGSWIEDRWPPWLRSLHCVLDGQPVWTESTPGSLTPVPGTRLPHGRSGYVTTCGDHLTWSAWSGPQFESVQVVIGGIRSNVLNPRDS